MTQPALFRSLFALLLTLQLLAGPASAAPEAAAGQLSVSQTQPEDANDPLRQWFTEQDQLLDDILVRLSRIEKLVDDIHRLIMALPFGSVTDRAAAPNPAPAVAAAPAPAPVVTPAATPKPVIVPPPPAKAAPSGILGFFSAWGTELAGIGLLLLVLMIGSRHARANKQKSLSASAAAPVETLASAMPAFLDEPEPELQAASAPALQPKPQRQPRPAPPPRPVTPIAPVVPAAPAASAAPAAPLSFTATASVQRGGATEPSQGHGDQALELAEIMLSMGLGHGAAQTLTEQIRHEPKQALRHWLRLLQIYRANGQQAEFEKSAEELRLHFNVQPEDWQSRGEAHRSIEDYPHIASRLMELWGRPSCLVYLSTLLSDNRGGARSGFPESVAEELLLLTAMLKADSIAPASTNPD